MYAMQHFNTVSAFSCLFLPFNASLSPTTISTSLSCGFQDTQLQDEFKVLHGVTLQNL